MASPTFPGPRLFGRQTGGQVVEDDPLFIQAFLQSSRNAAAERLSQQQGRQAEDVTMLRSFLEGKNQMDLARQRATAQAQLQTERLAAEEKRNQVPLSSEFLQTVPDDLKQFIQTDPTTGNAWVHPTVMPGFIHTINTRADTQKLQDTGRGMANVLEQQLPTNEEGAPDLVHAPPYAALLLHGLRNGAPGAMAAAFAHMDPETHWKVVGGVLENTMTGQELRPGAADFAGMLEAIRKEMGGEAFKNLKWGAKITSGGLPSLTVGSGTEAKTLADEALRVARMAPGPEKDAAKATLKEASGYQAQQAINIYTGKLGAKEEQPVGSKASLWINMTEGSPDFGKTAMQLGHRRLSPTELTAEGFTDFSDKSQTERLALVPKVRSALLHLGKLDEWVNAVDKAGLVPHASDPPSVIDARWRQFVNGVVQRTNPLLAQAETLARAHLITQEALFPGKGTRLGYQMLRYTAEGYPTDYGQPQTIEGMKLQIATARDLVLKRLQAAGPQAGYGLQDVLVPTAPPPASAPSGPLKFR